MAVEALKDEDLREMLPSGRQRAFVNRVAWALNYLLRAALVERVRRGVYRIAEDGKRLLAKRRSVWTSHTFGGFPHLPRERRSVSGKVTMSLQGHRRKRWRLRTGS